MVKLLVVVLKCFCDAVRVPDKPTPAELIEAAEVLAATHTHDSIKDVVLALKEARLGGYNFYQALDTTRIFGIVAAYFDQKAEWLRSQHLNQQARSTSRDQSAVAQLAAAGAVPSIGQRLDPQHPNHLASCSTAGDIVNPADEPLGDSAKAWLHEQNGQLLTFQNAVGVRQLVRVGRRLETATVPAAKLSLATINAEYATLAYSLFPVKRDSSGVVAYYGNHAEFRHQVNVAGDTRPGTNNLAADLLTPDDPKQERSLRDSTDLRSSLVLGGRTYTRLVVVDRLANNKYQCDPSAFEEVYYTAAKGWWASKTSEANCGYGNKQETAACQA